MTHEILAYVAERPRARDTFEGILRWWLLERWTERQRREVRRAVDELVEAGFLVATRGRDGRLRYGLDPARLDEARRLAADRDEEAPWPTS